MTTYESSGARVRESALAALAAELADRSALEMVDALGAARAPRLLKRTLALPFVAASRPLGRMLAELDRDTAVLGLAPAAALALERLGVELTVTGAAPSCGPLLVLSNHPGAYDALALMAAIGRRDLLILARDRMFLRALPCVSDHIAFVPDRPEARASALRRALGHLAAGGALLQFPCGAIEPDPDFLEQRGGELGPWNESIAPLVRGAARAAGLVMVAGVRGVHSRRIKRLLLTRFAEKLGVTTLAPLLQILARSRDVVTRVAFAEAQLAAELVQNASECRTVLRQRLLDLLAPA